MLKNKIGLNSNVKTLKSVILKHPKDAFKSQKFIDDHWESLNFISKPKYNKAILQYENLIKILNDNNVDIHYLPSDDQTYLDSIYTHDPMFMTQQGAIFGNMGKELRKYETLMMEEYFIKNNLPILGKIKDKGSLEGGDVIWVDKSTVAVGLTYRTNAEGINQLENILSKIGVNLIKVDLPHWDGPNNVLHLMSLISPLQEKLFLIYEKLIPVGFLNFLKAKNIKFLNIDESEYDTLACNVLPLSENKCLIVSGNDKTRSVIDRSGIETIEFEASEICYKGSGGPTCITRPILRK
ncbi:MAG: dimethylarginine dimethylaminohydrolase family protein [Dehalococcoidia bacterium]